MAPSRACTDLELRYDELVRGLQGLLTDDALADDGWLTAESMFNRKRWLSAISLQLSAPKSRGNALLCKLMAES
jgi:hypothetical protein